MGMRAPAGGGAVEAMSVSFSIITFTTSSPTPTSSWKNAQSIFAD